MMKVQKVDSLASVSSYHINLPMKGTSKQVLLKYSHQIITQNYAKYPKSIFGCPGDIDMVIDCIKCVKDILRLRLMVVLY